MSIQSTNLGGHLELNILSLQFVPSTVCYQNALALVIYCPLSILTTYIFGKTVSLH